MTKKDKYQFVEVEWHDAWQDQENFATLQGIISTHAPMKVKTRGYLLVTDEEGLSVANEVSQQADGTEVFRGRTFIPKLMVKDVTPLRISSRGTRQKKNHTETPVVVEPSVS